MIGKDVEDTAVCNGNIADIQPLAVINDLTAAFLIDPGEILYFRVIGFQRGAIWDGRNGQVVVVIAIFTMLGDPEDPVSFFVGTVVAPLIRDIESDHPKRPDADCQAANIYKGEQPVFVEVAAMPV